MKYVDIHTHALTHDPRIIEVQVLDSTIPVELSTPGSKHFCYGLHPWNVAEMDENLFFQGLKSAMQTPGFFALGETGIDRARKESLEKQVELFEKQIDYAIRFRLDRVVIHSVKAYSDVLPTLKKLAPSTIVIFHDFNGNIETFEQLSQLNAYFSFGTKLFNENTKAHEVFNQIPLDRIFLETDDQLDHSIFDIYKKASQLLNLDEEKLISALYQNFCDIYPEQSP